MGLHTGGAAQEEVLHTPPVALREALIRGIAFFLVFVHSVRKRSEKEQLLSYENVLNTTLIGEP